MYLPHLLTLQVSLLARQLSLTAMALVNAYHIAYWLKQSTPLIQIILRENLWAAFADVRSIKNSTMLDEEVSDDILTTFMAQ